jgi:hypothetical protein
VGIIEKKIIDKIDGRTLNRKGLKKGRSLGEVQMLLDQAKLDGNRMQITIWSSVLNKLKADNEKNK